MSHQKVQRKPVSPPNLKGLILGLLGASLLPTAIVALLGGRLMTLVQASLVFLALVAAAWLTRRGVAQDLEYQKRSLVAEPKPLKRGAMLLTAAAAGLLALGLNHYNLFAALVFAGLAGLGHYLYYGTDPKGEKISERLGGYSTEELVEIVKEAETRLLDIEHQRLKINSTELSERLGRIIDITRDVLSTLEKNPRELRRSRKFLNVYLEGAQRVTRGYAEMHDKTEADFLDKNFRDVLVTIEDSFKAHREKLLANDVLDLDIQIEVLKKQLDEDGAIH
ncbi:MAG TPA: 5-bromo-4-chloroindolyl phosphate hydrolase [Gammaproteobacteria bacterium]|nr:5-bromo-4-chloroindolyl phosphate hydrolase [Gammaproteobacteria bacterium]